MSRGLSPAASLSLSQNGAHLRMNAGNPYAYVSRRTGTRRYLLPGVHMEALLAMTGQGKARIRRLGVWWEGMDSNHRSYTGRVST